MAVVLNGRCFHSFAAWPVDSARLKTLSLSPNSQGINKLIKSAAHMGSPSRAAGMSGCYCQVCLMPRVRCFRGLVSLTVTFCPVRSGRARLKSCLGLALRLLRRLQVQSQAESMFVICSSIGGENSHFSYHLRIKMVYAASAVSVLTQSGTSLVKVAFWYSNFTSDERSV